MSKAKILSENPHAETKRKLIALKGQDWWDNTVYRRSHTKAEWEAFYLDFCKKKHPEKVAALMAQMGLKAEQPTEQKSKK